MTGLFKKCYVAERGEDGVASLAQVKRQDRASFELNFPRVSFFCKNVCCCSTFSSIFKVSRSRLARARVTTCKLSPMKSSSSSEYLPVGLRGWSGIIILE